VFESIGWSEADAMEAVRALLRGSLEALDDVGLPDSLSGPIRRGDAETVARHVAALEGIGTGPARPAAIYRELARAAVAVALRCGLEAGAAARIESAVAPPARPSGP
jgi:predicted short-subunit dehydrogenase-like oxidoreductase (DUF2520 family)